MKKICISSEKNEIKSRMRKFSRLLGAFTFMFSTASFVITLLGISRSPVEKYYALLLCGISALSVFLPFVLYKAFNFDMPNLLRVFLLSYIICGVLLGNVYDLYYRFPLWDKLLHFFSGILFMISGVILIGVFTEQGHIRLNKAFTIIVALLFTVTMGAIWEFVEYGIDSLLNVNMQRYMLPDGTLCAGRRALDDSMLDMLAAMLGAIITVTAMALKRGGYSKEKNPSSSPFPDENSTK